MLSRSSVAGRLFVAVFILSFMFSTAFGEERVRKCRHITAIDPFTNKGDYSILYPHISEVTMRTHFHSHQVAGYLGKLNTWLKGIDGAPCPTDDSSLLLHLVREFTDDEPLKDHASQAYNHALYFAMLRKNRTLVEVRPSNDDESMYVRVDGRKDEAEEKDLEGAEDGPKIVTIHGQTFRDRTHVYGIEQQPTLLAAIKKSFGSIKDFKGKFIDVAIGHFASGWVWLMVDPQDGKLSIAETHDGNVINGGFTKASLAATISDAVEDAQTKSSSSNVSEEELRKSIEKKYPAEASIDGRVPLVVLDVWEHAYYLDYQSKRKDYVEAWFKAVDWSLVAKRLTATDFELPKTQASSKIDYTYPIFY